jgi:hypothetical protein
MFLVDWFGTLANFACFLVFLQYSGSSNSLGWVLFVFVFHFFYKFCAENLAKKCLN